MYPACCVTGHRPKDMFGYDAIAYTDLSNKLYSCVAALHQKFGTHKFISGGAQGVDQIFFWAVNSYADKHDIENWVYVPCKTQGANWRQNGVFSKNEYNQMLEIAKANGTYNLLSEADYLPGLLFSRNVEMVNDSDVVIGVYNGDLSAIQSYEDTRSGTLHCLRIAFRRNRPLIIIIHPETLETTRLGNWD